MTKDEPSEPNAERAALSLERVLGFILVALVAYRLAYHASYLGEVPFAHATFSDGAVYEQSARDLLGHWPLGSRAFYLQGAYAYLLAVGMYVHTWPSLGLLLQLLVATFALVLFHRSAKQLWGQRAGMLASIAVLGHAGLTFYENKFVSAELGIACNIVVLATFVYVLRTGAGASAWRRWGGLLALGVASGFAVLARPNMILALPFCVLAVGVLLRTRIREEASSRRRVVTLVASLLVVVLGAALGVAPMAARNQIVTGHPDIAPVHGGGTSFFIGNNPKSKGVWNDGNLLSARLGTESQELAMSLGVDPELGEREQARAIGSVLYARSFAWIRENPGTWAKLEVHKLWLTVGDEQLTQDYDWLGERELLPWAHRVSVRFSWLMALALLGVVALRRRARSDDSDDSDAPGEATALPRFETHEGWAFACFMLGQVLAPLAANLLYFTSAQHRLPLVIPLALLAGPGALASFERIRDLVARAKDKSSAPAPGWRILPAWALLFAALLLVQGYWKRSKRTTPHPVHYYNLAMIEDVIGEPQDALRSLDRAIELRDTQPIFYVRRAHLRLRLGDLDGADADLDRVEELGHERELPAWVLDQADLDRHSAEVERNNAGQRGRPGGRFR